MKPRIEAMEEIDTYSPPNHSGTTNRKLVERNDCELFEMVHGTIEPGGVAERHSHEFEYQAMYILGGTASIAFDDGPGEIAKKGCIVRIPPGTEHFVESLGPEPLQLLIVYSPPLQSN